MTATDTKQVTQAEKSTDQKPLVAYSPPKLERIGDADALLEILGPAQAFYGRGQTFP